MASASPENVPDEERQRVVLDPGRPRPGRVAALVGRHRAEPRLAEGPQLMPPFVGRLGKPVEEEHDLALVRTGRPHVEREVADVDLRHRDPVVGLTRTGDDGGDRFAARRGPRGRVRRAPPRDGQPRTRNNPPPSNESISASLLAFHSRVRRRIRCAGGESVPVWRSTDLSAHLGGPADAHAGPTAARGRLLGVHRRLVRNTWSSTTTVATPRPAPVTFHGSDRCSK